MTKWSECSVVERADDKVSGAWVFVGTCLPVGALFQNLHGGATVDNFVEWFPGVQKEQVVAVLAFVEASLND